MFGRSRRILSTIFGCRSSTIQSLFSSSSHRRKPSRKPIIPLLRDLKSTPDPAGALHLLLHSPPSLLSYPACSSLLYRLARARLFPLLHTLLLFVRSHRVPCTHSLFNALIHHFGRAHLPQDALHLFFSIPCFNCPSNSPSVQNFNFLLNALVHNHCLDQAHSLFSRCSEFAIRPNVVTYNIILQAICEKDGLEAAHQLFNEMLVRGVRPSVVTYNILIGFMSGHGQLDKAIVLKGEMVRKKMQPNSVTYALLMEGLCRAGKYDAAKKMMFDMEYQGCKTRLQNYGVLMSDCGRRGDFEEVTELLSEMKRRKMKPDAVIYSILINYLCDDGRVGEAYKVLVDMQMKGCEPNAAIFRMMVDGFCQAGRRKRERRGEWEERGSRGGREKEGQ